jgi:tetratricopeptide (TPR) repeat protein
VPGSAELLTGAALSEQSLGRWEAALTHLQRAQSVDPRSILTARRLAVTLLWLRRYSDALTVIDRSLALGPNNLELLEAKTMVSLGQGDLSGARSVVRATQGVVEPTTLAAYFGTYWDLFWVLDDAQQQLLLRLSPSAFDGDRGTWGLVLAQTWYLRGETARARAYADSARAAFEEQLRGTPGNTGRQVALGLALAYMGRKYEAIRAGELATALVPLSKDAYGGPYTQHQLARIYILTGEPEQALDQLEPLLKIPYYLSPGWLKIDPNFDPLRNNPRFQKLVAGS